MNYALDVGDHGFILGLLYLIFKYFAPLIIVLIVAAILIGIGAVLYRRYKTQRSKESLVEGFKRIKKL